MRLIGLLPPPGSNRPDPPWAQANRLTVTLRGDARERDGITNGGIRLEGSYGGTATSLSLKYSGGLNGWRTGIFDADLSGTSPDSRSLAALFGFTPVAGGDEAGRFKLTGKGSLDAGIATTAEEIVTVASCCSVPSRIAPTSGPTQLVVPPIIGIAIALTA